MAPKLNTAKAAAPRPIAQLMPFLVTRTLGLPANASDETVLATLAELFKLAPIRKDAEAFIAAHRPALPRPPPSPGNAPPPPPPPPAALSPEEAHVARVMGITPEQMIASRGPVAPRPPRTNPDALSPEDLHVAKKFGITPTAMLATKQDKPVPVETEAQRATRFLLGR